jgi:hypothetical protein
MIFSIIRVSIPFFAFLAFLYFVDQDLNPFVLDTNTKPYAG